jgi:hypothetical protein
LRFRRPLARHDIDEGRNFGQSDDLQEHGQETVRLVAQPRGFIIRITTIPRDGITCSKGRSTKTWIDIPAALARGLRCDKAGPSQSGSSLGAKRAASFMNAFSPLGLEEVKGVRDRKLPAASLALKAAIAKLDKYHLRILDDLAYVTKDQAETSVLFELIGARYEWRSLLTTANQPSGEWGKISPYQAMTVAVVDRLVHHATIFEMNVESYRRRAALERKRGRGRPPIHATISADA